MRTITMLAQKGGCGRSTLATQLSVWATQQDELACIIDLDPQASAALWKSFRKAKLPLVQRPCLSGFYRLRRRPRPWV